MKIILAVLIFFLSSNIFSQENDSLVYEGEDIFIFKNLKDKKYYIQKGNGNDTIWKDLKFLLQIMYGRMQVLDEKNSMFYIDPEGYKVSMPRGAKVCGTVASYTCEIKEEGEQYILTKDETFYDWDNNVAPKKIDSINKRNIKKIYFNNNQNKISYNGNSFLLISTKTFPSALIVEKKDKSKGIFYRGKLTLYEDVIYDGEWRFKVKKNGKFGYYHITEIKYEELENFVFGLAKFKLKAGKTGFVDFNGNEYYD